MGAGRSTLATEASRVTAEIQHQQQQQHHHHPQLRSSAFLPQLHTRDATNKEAAEVNHQEYCERATHILNDLMDVSTTSSQVQHEVASFTNNVIILGQASTLLLQGSLFIKHRRALFNNSNNTRRGKILKLALTAGILYGDYWSWKPIHNTIWTDFQITSEAYRTMTSQIQVFKQGRMNHLVQEDSIESREEIMKNIHHFIYEKGAIDGQRIVLPSLYDRFRKERTALATDVIQMNKEIEELEQRVIDTDQGGKYADLRREIFKLQDIMNEFSETGLRAEFIASCLTWMCPSIQLIALTRQMRIPWIALSFLALPISASLAKYNTEVCQSHAGFRATDEAMLRDIRAELYLNVRTEKQIDAFANKIEQVAYQREAIQYTKPLAPPITLFDKEIEI